MTGLTAETEDRFRRIVRDALEVMSADEIDRFVWRVIDDVLGDPDD